MGDLTTTAEVKTYLAITGSGSDTILGELVSSVSARMESYMRRTIAETTYTAEVHSGTGSSHILVLDNGPITTMTTVVEDGDTVDAATYEADGRLLFKVQNGQVVGSWAFGERNIQVTYDAGYTTVPDDLNEACRKQVAFEYKQTAHGSSRLGKLSETQQQGGTTAFEPGSWAQGVKSILDHYKQRPTG